MIIMAFMYYLKYTSRIFYPNRYGLSEYRSIKIKFTFGFVQN